MSNEKQSIRALQDFRFGRAVPRRTWGGDLTGDAWKRVGSFNRPPLAYACEMWFTGDAVEWWEDWCDSQLAEIGHGGRELGSRIYDSWTVTAVVMAMRRSPAHLAAKLRMWLRIHWFLQALGASEHSQGQSWRSTGPTLTWTGMRSLSKRGGTAEIRGETQSLDGIFAMAAGLQYRDNRSYWERDVCYGLDMGLDNESRAAIRKFMSNGELPDLFYYFNEESGLAVTRVPINFIRWESGELGTLIEKDIGTSTPPVFGMVAANSSSDAKYLAAYTAGTRYVHGAAKDAGGAWLATAGGVSETMSLPSSERLYTIRVDMSGLTINYDGPVVDPPVEPPVEPPTRPPALPPVNDTRTPEWQIDAAARSLDLNMREQSLRHVRVAERLLAEELE